MYNARDGDDVVGRDQPWKAAKRERLRLRNEYVEARETSGRGRGLFARRAFVTGEVVCTFTGRVVPSADDLPADLRHYVVETRSDRVLVPEISEVGGHVANHSCRPNTTFAFSEREDTLFLEATRAIAAGDEITDFYNWLGFDNPQCLCGEEHCAGVIGFRWTRAGDEKWELRETDFCHALAVAAANRNATIKELVTRLCKTYPSTDEAVRLYRPVIVKAAESLPPEDGAWLLRLFKLER
ncbi:MAG TPA: SET domain-containing protein [Polyangiaceae bacterium]|jgi:hypothetical protein